MKIQAFFVITLILISNSCDFLKRKVTGEELLKNEKNEILEDLRGAYSLRRTSESLMETSVIEDDQNPVYLKFQNPKVISASNGVLDTVLEVSYQNQRIWNVNSKETLSVRLRNYNNSLVGPTLKLSQGDLLRVLMKNNLPPIGDVHCDPYGNTHHSLIDSCNQKNPASFNTTNLHTHGLHVSPKDSSDNVLIHLMPTCTFQNHIQLPNNHPQGTFWYHAHVHGSTAVQVSSGMGGALIVEGGLDTLSEIKAAEEKIFVLQQIPYTLDSASGIYGVEDFDASFGPRTWDRNVGTLGWRTMINGQTYPIIHLKSGEVQRWRFIHAGVREKIDLELEDHMLHEVALDGISLGRMDSKKNVEMHPGYRSDILIQAKQVQENDTLFLIDRESLENSSLLKEYESPKVLAIIIISPDKQEMKLPTNEQLAIYAPFETIKASELKGPPEKVWFNIDVTGPTLCFTVNGKPFSAKNPPRTLELNTASEWIITSNFVNHPFHIHVNSFEIFKVKKFDGSEIIYDPPIWRDTYLIAEKDTAYARSRYEDFDGDFVLHCHILDHEDQGMMQLVRITTPNPS